MKLYKRTATLISMNKKELSLPDTPGVYIFKDKDQQIIYIGKALSLKKRVISYFKNKQKDWKVNALLAEATTVDHIKTTTEIEALLLEAHLIQTHKPKYNVLLKSGQPFVYIHINQETVPHITMTRSNKGKGIFFGPFIHKQDARKTVDFLINTFQLFCCNKSIASGCLDYHLGKCAGTCLPSFDKESYRTRLLLAQATLQKNKALFLKTIDEKIAQHTQVLAFEKARTLYHYKENIETIFATLATHYSLEKYGIDIVSTTSIIAPPEDYLQTAKELQLLLALPSLPIIIDCFDISHFQSHYITGSCIRFNNGIPEKNKFRKFKIKSIATQNDYAALQEIVSRRYKNNDLPDLILIDGGKGQLSAIAPLFPQTPCASIAKREETIFSKNIPHGILLDLKTNSGKLITALRDYTHHFAISYHRLLRHKK